ncbi:MAG: nucleotidyltransferase substrate binding protein [Syntrophomonadaceae bacterium]|nr:nucleotidyltransferase substrate binding protein [Syntrophomonadaceae bacterium]
MDRLRRRIATAGKALDTLRELAVIENPSRVERDAAIQRFEYTVEAAWKAGQHYLREVEGLEIGSPKGVIRRLHETGLLREDETALALEMIDDRNLTVHTYNEPLAEEIFKRIRIYVPLLQEWIRAMKLRTGDIPSE